MVGIPVRASLACIAVAGAVLAPSTAADAATAHNVLSIHTTRTHTVAAPASARPGMVDVRNTGAAPIFLVRPLHGQTPAQLAKALNSATPADLIRGFDVLDAAAGHAHAYLALARGTYYLADTEDDNDFTAKSIATLQVYGTTVDSKVPASHLVRVSSHDVLAAPTSLARRTALRLDNRSRSLSLLVEFPVAPQVTDGQLQSVLARPSIDKVFEIADGEPAVTAWLSPGGHVVNTMSLAKGRHILVDIEYTTHTTKASLKKGRVVAFTVK